MKKIVGAVIGLIVVALVLVFGLRKVDRSASSEARTLDISGLKGPASNEEALYEVTVKTTQRSETRDGPVISVKGILAQSRQGDNDFISEWREISEFNLLDKPAEASMIAAIKDKPMMTSNNKGHLEHFLPKEFPAGLGPFQLGFLNKIFVPLFGNSNNPILSTEKDEAGTAKIQYDFTEEGPNIKVLKTWDRYVQDSVKIDAVDNMISYAYTPEHRLIQAKGEITTHYREPSSVHFTTTLLVKYKGPAPKPTLASVNKAELTKTDLRKATVIAQEMSRPKEAMSYDEAIKKLDEITDATDSAVIYEVFSTVKADLLAHPEHGQTLVQKITETTDRSESGQRKLALMFGALAQSNSPELADSLAKLATDCPDSFCKTQAMVALNDHENPTPESANKMLEIARSTTDSQIEGTALLAAGSVAKSLPDGQSDVSRALISELNDPAKAELKTTVIAAMGNHGASEYYSPLNDNLKSKDVGTRASAAYSMRNLPNAEVNGVLIGIMKSDPELDVQREAVKAMGYRNLSSEEYLTVAQQAAANPDRDLQQEAARVLLAAYRDNPKSNQAAIETLLRETKSAEVKSFIEEEMKAKAEADASAPNPAP